MAEKRPRHIELVDPPERLLNEVLLRVREEAEFSKARLRFAAFCVLFVASSTGVGAAFFAFLDGMRASGFHAFVSLLVTDGGAVLDSWQDFGYSLLESLPTTTLIVLLGFALTFFSSLQMVMREFKRMRGSFILARH